jgi:putative transposase
VHFRYRYRMYPDSLQAVRLARTFGCARVVFNDSLRLRDQLHEAGEKLSDTEIQTRVITDAKRAPERAWLSEVASVALVQACQDARRAYRNWFDSMSGKRKGRRAGHPRFRRKNNRQSVRLTRNGFRLRDNDRVYLAKIGEVKVRWSRELPSEPSSVTVIKEAAGVRHGSRAGSRRLAGCTRCHGHPGAHPPRSRGVRCRGEAGRPGAHGPNRRRRATLATER